jgi:hypothetical protein
MFFCKNSPIISDFRLIFQNRTKSHTHIFQNITRPIVLLVFDFFNTTYYFNLIYFFIISYVSNVIDNCYSKILILNILYFTSNILFYCVFIMLILNIKIKCVIQISKKRSKLNRMKFDRLGLN